MRISKLQWLLLAGLILLGCSFASSSAHAETGLPPGDPIRLVETHLAWNVWLEEATATQTEPFFRPLLNPLLYPLEPEGGRKPEPHLQPSHDYLLVVHLSERRYPYPQRQQTYNTADSSKMSKMLTDLLQSRPFSSTVVLSGALEADRKSRLLRYRISPPPLSNPVLVPVQNSMVVRLDRIRAQIGKPTHGEPATEHQDPFPVLVQNKDADFVYGQLVFRINTGKREGMIGLIITLQKDGQQIARLEGLTLCIASEANKKKACPGPIMAEESGDDPKVVKDLRWNFWTESRPTATSQPLFKPVPALEPTKGGRIVLDLAAINYKTMRGAVLSAPVNEKFKASVREWLVDGLSDVTLTIVAIPDRTYFELDAPPNQLLTIKLQKIRALLDRRDIKPPANLFEILAKEDPEWFFGRVQYPITAKDKEGWASIAFSIWAEKDGKTRPVDEIISSFCIVRAGSECTGSAEITSGLSGVDSLKLALEPNAPFPDASLHFVPLGKEGPVTGVFRRNDRPTGEFAVWPLDKEFTADKLKSHLSDSLLVPVAKAKTDQDLRAKGRNLYNFLFHSKTVARGNAIPPSEMDEGHKARLVFETFIRDRIKPIGTPPKDVPSVFVRLVGHDDLIPVGLLPIKPTEDQEDFLGFRFRVETPLKVQSYRLEAGCISRWALAAPTEQHHEQELTEARMKASTVLAKWRAGISDEDKPINMRGFEDWLAELTQDQTPSAIVTLSHHNRNQLRLEPQDDIAQSDAIQRQFLKPSLAVLSGCGTAKPGANEFIRKLNERGINAVIATSAEVDPPMAGDFFNCLDATLEQHKSEKTYTISQAYFDTLQCLKDKKPSDPDSKYGARVLKYALLGNGNLKLCLPKKP